LTSVTSSRRIAISSHSWWAAATKIPLNTGRSSRTGTIGQPWSPN
jgi:hypothetical protein